MILYALRFLPSRSGGGSPQRYWKILEALAKIDSVHLLVVQPAGHTFKFNTDDLESLPQSVSSITLLSAPEWVHSPLWARLLNKLKLGWLRLIKHRSFDIPELKASDAGHIASQLPVKDFKLVFSARLSSARFVDIMLQDNLITADRTVCDFDDILSDARERELNLPGYIKGWQSRAFAKIEAKQIRAAEDHVAKTWDAVSVCSEKDVQTLCSRYPDRHFYGLPNIVDKARLPAKKLGGEPRLLFVGNLSYGPNVQGLQAFLSETLPLVRRSIPNITMSVVGINPEKSVVDQCRAADVDLYPNAPSVEQHYLQSDIVVVPINLGGGTRVKIVEAMAYGRAVVSTDLGAEGLNLVSGKNIMLANSPDEFANSILTLWKNPTLRENIVTNAIEEQKARFSSGALAEAVFAFTGLAPMSTSSQTTRLGA